MQQNGTRQCFSFLSISVSVVVMDTPSTVSNAHFNTLRDSLYQM